MKLRTLIYLYGWRLRAHPFQELLAGAGIAAGVALLFAVQVANTSITASMEQLFRGMVGDAQLRIGAGDEHGFDQRLTAEVARTPGVAIAAPVFERRAIMAGPTGDEALELFGLEASFGELGGRFARNFGRDGLRLPRRGVVIPDDVARSIGADVGDVVTLEVGGSAHRVRVSATLGEEQIGDAAGSPVVLGTLPFVQRLIGARDRVTSIYVIAEPGAQDAVRERLEHRFGDRLDVGPADMMLDRLRVATAANDQSTALFSAVSAMIGLLFAFNAMLLTVPERRRFVADLRTQGATGRQIVAAIGFQAVTLGVVASLAGLLLGDVLSRSVFQSVPGYLAFTFAIGTQRIVPFSAIALAFGAGILAALVAACRPLADLLSRDAESAYEDGGEPGEAIGPRLRTTLLGVGVALLVAIVLVTTFAPSVALVAILALTIATLLAMPAVFSASLTLVDRVASRLGLRLLTVATMGARAATTRSIAVAAIAAVAVLGNIAIGGAREDLVRGIHAGFADHLRTADLWVTTAGRSLTTDSFELDDAALARLRAAPAVADVRLYRGGMFDVGSRRIWVIGRPRADAVVVPPSQVTEGDPVVADGQVRGGGWAAVSTTIADERDLGVGDLLRIRTPGGGIAVRVAATVSNLGWGPGAIVLDADAYRRAWRTSDPSALEIELAAGVAPAEGRRQVEQALGPAAAALDVQSAQELEAEFRGVLHEGLTRLTQISTLLLIASALALSAVMSAAVWERRRLLATYKLEGVKRRQLGAMLLYEALLVLGIGCGIGALAGVYGHLLGDRWLELTTGFRAPFSLQLEQGALTLLAIVVASLAIVAVPGWIAARVPARWRFQE